MAIGAITHGLGKIADTAGGIGNAVVNAGGSALGAARDLGSTAVQDTVDLSHEALDAYNGANNAVNNFQDNVWAGAFDWAQGLAQTGADLATHPVESAQALGSLATNPVLGLADPFALPVDFAVGALQGKGPDQVVGDGLNQVKDVGTGLASDYAKEYDQHGVGGVVGSLLPDVAIAALTDGGSVGADAAATGAKDVAKTVVEGATKDAAKDVAKSATEKSVKDVVVDGLIPNPREVGPEAVDKARPDQNGG